ncbi:MAG: ATP-binding protein [Gammaproteobacteria bacterium]|nr:ATP-binding protein [Gammaproteobacteria bacterium]
MATVKRKLPIGIQTFREIRDEHHYYVDKTAFAAQLVEEGKHYFLSRPRRFGKSLFVDTLKELFEGNEPLFRGLDVHGDWDWSVRYPVVRLDFGLGSFNDPGQLHSSVMAQLDGMERRTGVEARYETGPERFANLVAELHRLVGQRVVVLVDEYDKPILDALGTPEVARANRDYLGNLYSVVKAADADIKLTFFTGVSKSSKVSLFSGLNNLVDITIDPDYAELCGYSDQDLDSVFAAELEGLDRLAVRDWYNGYHWLGETKVYNPFDILLLFRNRRFGAYWFETGTPTFLIDTLRGRRVPTPSLDGMMGTEELLSTFDIDDIATEALLFQTGYLTILGEEHVDDEPLYRLGYPNREVRQSLNRSLLRSLVPDPSEQLRQGIELRRLLAESNFDGLETLFRALFAAIPYQWHVNNDIANFEGYYASVFYSHFAATGLDVVVEDSSSRGRVDMAVRYEANVYLFEFKVVERAGEGSAISQLRERGYADKYAHLGEPIYLIGVEFSKESRNVAGFVVENA